MTDFGKNLKKILDDRGISQRWLADAAKTQEATISRYITGVNKSSRLDILVNIAKALDVSTDFLLGITDVPKTKSATTTEERILLNAFNNASERDKAVLWQLLEPYMTTAEKTTLFPSKTSASSNLKIG